MLNLRYTRANDGFQYCTVYGDPMSIADLYWQLTRNYTAVDGTKIGEIEVRDNIGGRVDPVELIQRPYSVAVLDNTLQR